MSNTKDSDDYRKQLEEGYKAYKKDLSKSEYKSDAVSGWSSAFYFIGSINILIGLIGLIGFLDTFHRDNFAVSVAGFSGGIVCFFFAYVTQMIFDCRRYLKKIAERK